MNLPFPFNEESRRSRLPHACERRAFRFGAALLAMAIAGAASAQEALFKMNEPSWAGAPPQVIDSTGHGNDGASVNGANTVVDPTYGNVGSFNGVNQYVQVGGNFMLTGARSYTAWVNVPSYSTPLGMPILDGGVPGAGDFFGISGTGGQNWSVPYDVLYVDDWGSQDEQGLGALVPLGQWDFVAVTYDGANTLNFYINGLSDGTWVGNGMFDYNINTVTLGGGTLGGTTTNASMAGEERYVGIWTSELSAGQIQSLYQSQAVPEPTPLAAFAVAGISLLLRRKRRI